MTLVYIVVVAEKRENNGNDEDVAVADDAGRDHDYFIHTCRSACRSVSSH